VARVADLLELCEAAIRPAHEGEQAEAFAAENLRTEVKTRAGEVDSLSASESRGVGVRVVIDGRLGYAWSADPGPRDAAGLVEAARANASLATVDEANQLPVASPEGVLPWLFRPSMAALETTEKVNIALDLERAAISSHPDVRKVEDVLYGDSVSRVALASTVGTSGEYARTDCWCMVSALAERDGETQSGFSFRVARETDELPWREVASEAAMRGARLLGATKPETEKLPVVLDPWAAAGFLGVLANALSAEERQKGRSLVAGLVDELIASPTVTLVDDGRLPEGPASSPFDDEGVPTTRTVLVEKGKLRGFLHNSVTARREGRESTGNASRPSYRGVPGVSPSNLFLVPGTEAPEDVLGRAGRAVYVQDLTGLHSGANPVSGEFSVGATGLRLDGGTFGEPLREMTIASTLLDVLKQVVAVGSDLRFYGGSIGSPTLLIGEMTVAGH
jgi:PmbA protein